ncbi:MAG: hypothetical protein KAS23_02385 [Anaerohalosphaera sp.]|nr:hypothetical protein [Anaerohalosphaera sp.]
MTNSQDNEDNRIEESPADEESVGDSSLPNEQEKLVGPEKPNEQEKLDKLEQRINSMEDILKNASPLPPTTPPPHKDITDLYASADAQEGTHIKLHERIVTYFDNHPQDGTPSQQETAIRKHFDGTLGSLNKAKESEAKIEHEKANESTRKELSLILLKGGITVIAIAIVAAMLYNFLIVNQLIKLKEAECETILRPLNVLEVIAVLTTFLGSSFGFIFGYYFKKSSSG